MGDKSTKKVCHNRSSINIRLCLISKGASQEEFCRTLATYLRVNPKGRSVFDEGFNDSAATECVRSHHQHLVLLHSVEERSHVGPDRLQIDDQKHQIKAWKALEHNKTPKLSLDNEEPYTLTFLRGRGNLIWTSFCSIWCFAFGTPAGPGNTWMCLWRSQEETRACKPHKTQHTLTCARTLPSHS